MKIQILRNGRDSKIQLLDDDNIVMFDQYNTYDELGSAGVEATENLAEYFGRALGIPVETDEIFDEE